MNRSGYRAVLAEPLTPEGSDAGVTLTFATSRHVEGDVKATGPARRHADGQQVTARRLVDQIAISYDLAKVGKISETTSNPPLSFSGKKWSGVEIVVNGTAGGPTMSIDVKVN